MNKYKTLYVIKRNGLQEPMQFDKITARISLLCDNLSNDINPTLIAQKVCVKLYDGIKTSDLDEIAAETCIDMMTTHIDYEKLASRIIISNNQKNTSPSFTEAMSILYNNNGKNHLISDEIYDIIMQNKNKLNTVTSLNSDRDYLIDYFGFKTLEKSYLMAVDKKVIERIQYLFMRVSIGIHKHDIKSAIESYDMMSQKYFIHATPTLFNAGTPKPQLCSCFLLGTDDSVIGMYKTISDCAQISASSGGIGISIQNIRSKGAYIRGSNGVSNGIIPLCQVLNQTARHIDQGGKRPGSFAIFIEPHHPDIIDFLELKTNDGDEHRKARDLFTGLMISDLFMKRVLNDSSWSLFDPDTCPLLFNSFGALFEQYYEEYEQRNIAVKVVPAKLIWSKIIKSQIETGVPYIVYKDSANSKSNQQNIGVIKNSNLCVEILEYSDSKEYAVCTLASISLPSCIIGGVFDFKLLEKICNVIVKNLNKIIEVNYYPVPETELSNKKHRPIGVGVQGLADVYAIMGMCFDSEEALELNKLIFETLYWGCINASMELSKTSGPYSTFNGSPISKGIFQFDMWGVVPSARYNWDELRENVKTYGVSNSLCIALMPTASTSQILGNNECIEPFTANIYSRKTNAGIFTIVNKHLIHDLNEIGLWNNIIKDKIIVNHGSVQLIQEIPQPIKNKYKTAFELKQKDIINQSIARGPYICQTQSLNLFFNDTNGMETRLTSALFYGWKNGLKTGSYYIRPLITSSAQQFTIDPKLICESCSG